VGGKRRAQSVAFAMSSTTFMAMAQLPLSANVLFATVMATTMPYVGRG